MAVSKEFNQEIVNPTAQSSTTSNNAVSKQSTANNGDIDRRLTELERFMASMALEKEPQNKTLKRMEQRLDELAALIEAMHKPVSHVE